MGGNRNQRDCNDDAVERRLLRWRGWATEANPRCACHAMRHNKKKRAIEPHYSQSHNERTVKAVVQEGHLYWAVIVEHVYKKREPVYFDIWYVRWKYACTVADIELGLRRRCRSPQRMCRFQMQYVSFPDTMTLGACRQRTRSSQSLQTLHHVSRLSTQSQPWGPGQI